VLDVKKIIDSFETLKPFAVRPHPRLYIDPDTIDRVREPACTEMLRRERANIDHFVARLMEDVTVEYDLTVENSNLERARFMQAHVYALLGRYFETGEEKYRLRVLDCIREMDSWETWSWFDWRAKAVPDWEAPFVSFDLSFGENSMTVGVVYDVLYDTLSKEEKQLFYDLLSRHQVIREFLRHVRLGPGCARDGAGWIQNEKCNWISVLCGGMGVLALAFYDELEEARQAFALCDAAMMTMFDFINACDGSWPEGLGYYAYTLRYAVPYLISYENATGEEHPAFSLPGMRNIMHFFMDFQPGGYGCTYGDSNCAWEPLGYHYMLCRRLGIPEYFAAFEQFANNVTYNHTYGPVSVDRLLFANRKPVEDSSACETNVVRLYRQTNFGVMADRVPGQTFAMTIRGGNTNGPHEHNDLSSFHLVSNGERFIVSCTTDEYLDTTFSGRRDELFEMGAGSKNVMLVNGVGMKMYNEVEQKQIECCGYRGIQMDCTKAMGSYSSVQNAVNSYKRTFLMLQKDAFLIFDDLSLPHAGVFDARFHTETEAVEDAEGVILTSPKDNANKLRIAFSASQKSGLIIGRDIPTTPKKDPVLIRYMSDGLFHTYALATLLTKDLSASVSLKAGTDAVFVTATVGGKTHELRFSADYR